MSKNRKTRRELTAENERIINRLNWFDKNVFGKTFIWGGRFRIPAPLRQPMHERLELLETKIDLILEHLDLKVKAVPNSIVLKKKNKKKELVVTRKVTDA